jgi:sensor histidine kinase YesM
MYNIALDVKRRDWLYILLIGVVFAMMLSSLGYIMMHYSWLHGALYGFLLGFNITLFSLIFITFMNQKILPKIREVFWLPLAIAFSFFSGFFGTLISVLLANVFDITLIALFHTNLLQIAVAIGVLTYIVGALLYRFVKMRNEKELADHHYIQSRLRSLETQLNPHFLFNALNSIAELIHQDPDKAEEAVIKVSSFMRNTMNEKAELTIKEEIKNVNAYIDLENIRFGGAIHLHVSTPIPSWVIPKFSIQLLVENAIKHGFDATHKALHVRLSFDEKKGIIVVENDGKAMHNTAFGIGLSNLDQRLKLLCKGSLHVKHIDPPTFHIFTGVCHENTDR